MNAPERQRVRGRHGHNPQHLVNTALLRADSETILEAHPLTYSGRHNLNNHLERVKFL